LQADLKQLFSIDLQPLEVSTKGWNWGDIEIQGSILTFIVDGKRGFELPLSDVSRGVLHGTVGTKNDVSLEFNQDDNLPDDAESVTEIRFHFPTSEDDKNQSQVFSLIDEFDFNIPLKAFLNKVLSKADVGATTGKSLIMFDKMPILTPR
jgi:structure-specific recognition protein 1